MSRPQTICLDMGGLDGIRINTDVTLDKLPLATLSNRIPIPEEYMDRLEKLLGDGRATVTFGLDVKTNEDFGNGAGCSVFVKLTCDQSEAGINNTRLVAQELAEIFVAEGQAHAKRILDQARGFEPAPEVAKEKPRVPTKAVKEAVDPEPRSQKAGLPKKLHLPGKPSFKR